MTQTDAISVDKFSDTNIDATDVETLCSGVASPQQGGQAGLHVRHGNKFGVNSHHESHSHSILIH